MSTAALDASLRTLTQSVTNRLSDEERFKREVYDKINVILRRLNVCASNLASSPAPAIASAGVDLTEQLRALNVEVARLQSNRLTEADSDYVTQPLRAEANENLKWNTDANKTGFRPPDYRVGPPPYPGDGSRWPSGSASAPSGSASAPSGSASSFSLPSFPSFASASSRGAEGVKPIRPTRGTDDPRYGTGGWSPRRTPRRTPRRSPKKKTYRR